MSDYIIISSEARNSMLNFPFPAELLCFLMFPKDAKEKAMAPHSNTLAWKISWTEGPAGLQSMGSLRVGHDWATSLSLFTFMHWRRKWQPTPMFLPGESQERGDWWAAICGVAQSQTWLKWLKKAFQSESHMYCIVFFINSNYPNHSPQIQLKALYHFWVML